MDTKQLVSQIVITMLHYFIHSFIHATLFGKVTVVYHHG